MDIATPQTPSQAIAAELADRTRRIADAIALLPMLEPANALNFDLNMGELDRIALGVHHCTPSQLDAFAELYPNAESHRDADDILKWIEAHVGAVEITFYRR